jgi:hypothetical protein
MNDTEDLNNAINQLGLIDIYRTLHRITADFIIFLRQPKRLL